MLGGQEVVSRVVGNPCPGLIFGFALRELRDRIQLSLRLLRLLLGSLPPLLLLPLFAGCYSTGDGGQHREGGGERNYDGHGEEGNGGGEDEPLRLEEARGPDIGSYFFPILLPVVVELHH